MEYSLDTKIKELLKNEDLRNKIDEIAPGLVDHPKISMVKGFSLKACSKIIPKQLSPEVLEKIEAVFAEENAENKQ